MGTRLRALGARFDGTALRPFDSADSTAITAITAITAPAWPALRDWCLKDLASPWQVAFHGAPDVDMAAQRAAAVALVLDGSDRLSACQGALDRIWLRLTVKLQDARFWGAAQAGDVWDSGFVPDLQSAWQALARFEPRRPTFIVVKSSLSPERADVLSALQKRSTGFAKPVRVLLLIKPGEPAPPGAAHIPA